MKYVECVACIEKVRNW